MLDSTLAALVNDMLHLLDGGDRKGEGEDDDAVSGIEESLGASAASDYRDG
jgi:hypothetical protein